MSGLWQDSTDEEIIQTAAKLRVHGGYSEMQVQVELFALGNQADTAIVDFNTDPPTIKKFNRLMFKRLCNRNY